MPTSDRCLPINNMARRVRNLEKPAPLKRILSTKADPDKLNVVNSVVNSAKIDIKEKILPVSEAKMTTLEKPSSLNTKARRVGKLEKPAPLKRSLSANTGSEEKLNMVTNGAKTDNSAEDECAKRTVIGTESEMTGTDKVEDASSAGLSSRRLSQRKNLKLVKPRPLKKKSDDTSPTETLETPLIGNTEKADSLPSCISDSDDRATYTSQLSRDSGIGDMERFDRRTSQLSSLGEDDVFSPEPVILHTNRNSNSSGSLDNQSNEDDLDWNDLDEPSKPFIFGHQHLKYTSFAVNQAVPFNSFKDTDNSDRVLSTPGRGRGRGRGRGSSKNQTQNNVRIQKPQYLRSQSVPISVGKTQTHSVGKTQDFRSDYDDDVKNWDPEINNNVVNNIPTNHTDKMNNNNWKSESMTYRNDNSKYSGNSDSRSVFSEDWEGDLIDSHVKVDNVQNCVQNEFESKDGQDSFQMRLPRQSDSMVYNYSIQNSVNQEHACERDRMTTPEPSETVNCDKDFNDLETTPKANDKFAELIPLCVQFEEDSSMVPPNVYVSNYSPYFPPVQKPDMKASSHGQNSESSTRSTTPVNVNPQDCIITPVKDPWDVLQKSENDNTQSVTSYRSKRLDYDTCSSDSKSKASDTDSVATFDNGFKEQECAWELIDDLTDKLQDVVLDTGSSNRSSVAESEDNIVPVEMKETEEGLAEKSSEVSGSVLESDVNDNDNVSKVTTQSETIEGAGLKVIRNPLIPSSMLQEIWKVEQTMSGGMYSAKGRRKMFRNYAICRELETVTDEATMIQYSIDELLRLGASPLSRQEPETWSYLTAIYPDICLKEVSKFFDVERYREEREYVVENFLVKDNTNRVHSTRQGSLTDASSRQGRPAGFQGMMYNRSISMPAGTGSQETSSLAENQSDFGTQHHGFGHSNQQGARPSGFGSPEEPGTRPKGFGVPPQKQKVTNAFVNSDLDTKCDISVRSNGLSKVFSETSDILGTGYMKLDDPTENESDVGQKQYIRQSSCFAGQKPRNNSDLLTNFNRESITSEEEFYMNRDLPEQCPW